jgi:hypothetical protein
VEATKALHEGVLKRFGIKLASLILALAFTGFWLWIFYWLFYFADIGLTHLPISFVAFKCCVEIVWLLSISTLIATIPITFS